MIFDSRQLMYLRVTMNAVGYISLFPTITSICLTEQTNAIKSQKNLNVPGRIHSLPVEFTNFIVSSFSLRDQFSKLCFHMFSRPVCIGKCHLVIVCSILHIGIISEPKVSN